MGEGVRDGSSEDRTLGEDRIKRLLEAYEGSPAPDRLLELIKAFRLHYAYTIPETARLFEIPVRDMQRFEVQPDFIRRGDARRITGIIRREIARVSTKYYIARDTVSQDQAIKSDWATGRTAKTGWVRIVNPEAIRSAQELHEALEEFIRLWQRSSFRSHPDYALDEDYRAHLIADCEILLAMLRNGHVEHGLLRGASARVKAAGVAATFMLGLASGIAGGAASGAATVVAERMLGEDDRRQAGELGHLADRVDERLRRLEEQLPYGPEDGRTPDEEQAERKLGLSGRSAI